MLFYFYYPHEPSVIALTASVQYSPARVLVRYIQFCTLLAVTSRLNPFLASRLLVIDESSDKKCVLGCKQLEFIDRRSM